MNAKTCQKCGKCCLSNIGAFIFPSDVYKISNYLQISPSNFLLQWCDKHIIKIKNKELKVFVLKIRNGKCAFLDTNNLCKIFECRPYQCINAPYNFLSKYSFWSHMPCIEEKDFVDLDSSYNDKIIFSELLSNKYEFFIGR